MIAQTVLPDEVGVLPQARDNALTMARPDTSMPFGGDGTRMAGVLLSSATAIVNAVIASKPSAILIAPTDVKALIAPLTQAKQQEHQELVATPPDHVVGLAYVPAQ